MEKTNFLDALVTAELSLFGIADRDAESSPVAPATPAQASSTAPDFTVADYRSAAG
ncbi:Uncharacterised protein [Bordetella ansorpii]|uniref:Uncharacterized protein n=1 Tax=Bordetella ansorpii TaxID=288768 RepID=A0A157SLY8_9BORD|nr:hypothetical protein [Bordetella ansorpii]SAI71499.1 Uncharacterised protein [Bordetella ansorpii]